MSDDACDLLCLDPGRAEEIRARLSAAEEVNAQAARAKSLSDPSRLRVAAALQQADELCVCDLAWICGLSQTLASHHLRVLQTAGMAASRRDGRLVMYALTGEGRHLLAAVTRGTPQPMALPS